jgi:hypothetical protein
MKANSREVNIRIVNGKKYKICDSHAKYYVGDLCERCPASKDEELCEKLCGVNPIKDNQFFVGVK